MCIYQFSEEERKHLEQDFLKKAKFGLDFCESLCYSINCLCEKVVSDRKEVNTSNEGRNPSQLSADYDQMRLR